MSTFGLVGYPLSHSYSPQLFQEIFDAENAQQHEYKLFPLKTIKDINKVLNDEPDLLGFNVTIPYKKEILTQLYEIDPVAIECWAVNTVKVSTFKGRKTLKGYNTDMPAFLECIEKELNPKIKKALILGSGGAASAAKVALKQLNIDCTTVTRQIRFDALQYADIDANAINAHKLIVNCTPLGMFPDVESCPEIPFRSLTDQHIVFDMVYNPSETLLMRRARAQGAKTINGLEMLKLQAQKAWEIWNS